MRVVSFNTNGIRARFHQLERLVQDYQPDIIGIQETKVIDEDFPLEFIQSLGYHAEYFGQKSHYGVALLSRKAPVHVMKGLPHDTEDAQRRLILAEYEQDGQRITVINGYFPQGESRDHPLKFPAKEKFYADLNAYLCANMTATDNMIVMGDMNISPEDIDIGIGVENAKRWLRTGKCSFLPEEREWLTRLKNWGLADTFRKHHPDADDHFSWFDYRSRGFEREPKHGLRIDLILATAPLLDRCTAAGISYDIRGMEKPSDHCPIWADFSLD